MNSQRRKKKLRKATKRKVDFETESESELESSNLPLEYKLPSTIYENALNKLKEFLIKDSCDQENRLRCHQNTYNNFNTCEPVDCNANILQAAKQALEDREFRVLYDIISKALNIRDNFLMQQMLEYMEIAITLDPKIENRDEVMTDFISRVRLLNNEPEDYLSIQHTLSRSFADSP